jgi:DNA-binding NarL/FixJ family response regulator
MNKFNEINDLPTHIQELSTDKESLSASKPLIARDLEKLPKKKAGRPRHLVLATTQNEVYELSKVGTRYEDIALVLGFSEDTLTKYYRNELDKGRIESNAIIAGTLFEKAKQGDTASMMFWLKTRAQWSEKNTTELTGEGGAPINIKVVTGIE